MSETPVMLLKSLTIGEYELMLLQVNDCVLLDTAGFQERLRVNGFSRNQDDPEKFDLHCTTL